MHAVIEHDDDMCSSHTQLHASDKKAANLQFV